MPSKLNIRRKPLIVIDALELREWNGTLFSIIESFGWQPFDLSLSNFHIPTNPAPAGAIISIPQNSPRKPLYKKQLNVPTVFVGGDKGNQEYGDFPAVLIDRKKAGAMAVDHLVEKGFKDIILFTQNDWQSASLPFKGAYQRAEEKNITLHIHQLMIRDGESAEEKQVRWIKERGDVIMSLPKPLACITTHDYTAAKLCFDCQSYGLSVPEDVAILGSSNLESVCNSAIVPLSSVDWNWELAFQTVAEMLNRLLRGEPIANSPIMIPPKGVITRRSTDILAVQEPRVAKAIRFMWDHLDLPITVDDVAFEVGVNRRTLTRLFSDYLGRGVKEELNRKRLERAAELLLTSDLSISEISHAVGYPSQPYFQRAFLKNYDTTPGNYRSQNSTH